MYRTAFSLLIASVLALSASQTWAKDNHGGHHRGGGHHGYHQRHHQGQHHGYSHYRPHYGSYGYYRPPVVVYPRPYVYAAPPTVVPVYPPAYGSNYYYYEQPGSYFHYRGRGISLGIGL